jgi:hypothetical protein
MTNNTLHRDKTISLAAGLPIAMVLLLVPAVAEAHGQQIVRRTRCSSCL